MGHNIKVLNCPQLQLKLHQPHLSMICHDINKRDKTAMPPQPIFKTLASIFLFKLSLFRRQNLDHFDANSIPFSCPSVNNVCVWPSSSCLFFPSLTSNLNSNDSSYLCFVFYRFRKDKISSTFGLGKTLSIRIGISFHYADC